MNAPRIYQTLRPHWQMTNAGSARRYDVVSSKPRKILRYCDLILRTSHNWNSLKAGTPADRILIHKSAGTPSGFLPLPTDQNANRLWSELRRRGRGRRPDEIWRVNAGS